jgi:hypothetical protein
MKCSDNINSNIFSKYSYKFELAEDNAFRKSEIIFSSYPGAVSSTDDFYITDAKLVITETTLDIVDADVYRKNISDEKTYIPSFMRILAATRTAKSAVYK